MTVEHDPKRILLSLLAGVALGLAALTLLPFSRSHTNLIGYHSLCAFVPLSTLILLGLAAFFRMCRDSLDRPARHARSSETESHSESVR